MIRNNFRTALRFLNKNRIFTTINTLGLAVALTVSFLILLFVINEFSYNRFNKQSKRIFRVLNYYDDFKTTQSGTPYVLASKLKSDFPQVEAAIRSKFVRNFKLQVEDEFIPIQTVMATDPEFFDIFTINMTSGTSDKHLLEDKNSIVLSKELATKFFKVDNAVGKQISGMVNDEEQLFTVTGVYEDIPVNSTIKAKCIVNSYWTLAPINKTFGITNADQSWSHDFWITWILLSPGSDHQIIENQFASFEKKYISENPKNHYSLQKLSDVYLNSDYVQNNGISGNIRNVRLFSLIAILIIVVAGINYIILSTAVSSIRAKEIGIRKTFGAGNNSIRNQMLSESVTLVILVLPIALLLTWLALPYTGKLFQKELLVINTNLTTYIAVYLILALLIGISSGLYASVYLSKLNVLDVLKNTAYIGKRKIWIRSSLIVIQLVIFCSFVASMFVMRSQYQFALKKDTGHFKENILQIDLGFNFTGYSAFLNNIKANPDIISAAGVMEGIPMLGSMSFIVPNFEDKNIQVKVEGLAVDYNFIETMGFTLLEGRSFSDNFGTDLEKSVILNETAVKQLGIKDPLGKMVGGKNIIGVVKDFNLHSIHSEIPPLSISMTDKYICTLVVRYKSGTLPSVLKMLETEWEKIAPDIPFNFITIEDFIKEIYASEKSLTTIVSLSAIFTLVIAAFGLFGLTLFVATTRIKEIGIKKVLGSSEKAILFSLLRENFVLVLISTVLSIPVTLHFMHKWLTNYSYKVNISWWVFVLSFGIASVVVILTVYFHSLKMSRANPVNALRHD